MSLITTGIPYITEFFDLLTTYAASNCPSGKVNHSPVKLDVILPVDSLYVTSAFSPKQTKLLFIFLKIVLYTL